MGKKICKGFPPYLESDALSRSIGMIVEWWSGWVGGGLVNNPPLNSTQTMVTKFDHMPRLDVCWVLFDRGKYTKVAEFNPLQWSSSHTYIALSTTFEATNSRRITDGGFPLWGQVSPHRRPSTVLASMKLYDLINAPHCLRGEGGIITLHPMNVEACRKRAIADAASSSSSSSSFSGGGGSGRVQS